MLALHRDSGVWGLVGGDGEPERSRAKLWNVGSSKSSA